MSTLSPLKIALGAGFALCVALSPLQRANAADVVRVGEGPFITGGGFYVANERGYFKKMGLDIQVKKFNDGALAVPSMLAGELDISLMTANAGFFNSVAKGAPMVIVLDRGQNKPGYGYTAINVTQELYDSGVKKASDFAKLKGKRIGVGAVGSINQ
ncbi:MAG: ABC transporter substrate-binding protein, partial [Xanthobacteraceae bacterium]